MAWIKLIFEVEATAVEPFTDRLMTLGAVAASLLDAGDDPILEPKPGELRLWSNTRVLALFPADAAIDRVIAGLADHPSGRPPAYRQEILEDQDWSRTWLDHFQPMQFGRRLWVTPTAHPPPDPTAVNLRLDPGLAFGTGAHPTTALCLEWLEQQPLTDRTVLDFGCGSGILAIAALLLGAKHALGIDSDPQAHSASRANAALNGVADRLSLIPDDHPAQADALVANILANPLIELAPRLASTLTPGGPIALSGILRSQAEPVTAAYRPWFDLNAPVQREDWVLISGVRRR